MRCLSLTGSGCLQEGAKGAKKLPECVLEVPSLHEVELNYGSQNLPDFSRPGSAAGEPIMKERALLQVGMQSPGLPLPISPPAGLSHACRRQSIPRQCNLQRHSCCGTQRNAGSPCSIDAGWWGNSVRSAMKEVLKCLRCLR